MKILFDQMPVTVNPNFKGGEGEFHTKMVTDANNKILQGKLTPGSTIGYHVHETNSEIIYVLSGTGKVLYEGDDLPLKAGDCHYCPKGKGHSLINDSQDDLVVFAVIPEHGA